MPKARRVARAPAPMPFKSEQKKSAEPENPLFKKRTRDYGIGNDIQPPRDLTHFVKWPRYVRVQRQRRVLYDRLKVPPSINQFTKSLDKNLSIQLFRLAMKYRPETQAQKKDRLKALAEEKKEEKSSGKVEKVKKPFVLKFGLNHITSLIESKKAQLVVIAHDVDPIELVIWLPALCRKMDVPYCIVKGKARLGELVNMKTATAVAFVNVRQEDKKEFSDITKSVRELYNDKYTETQREWGSIVNSQKTDKMLAKRDRIRKQEMAFENQWK